MGGTLRRYLEAHDAFPTDQPLIAVCPVSVRSDDEQGQMNNKVSAMFTSLATDVDDPIERLRTINQVTKGAKEDHNVLGANLLQDWAEHAAPDHLRPGRPPLLEHEPQRPAPTDPQRGDLQRARARRSRSTTRVPSSSTRSRWDR